MTYRYPSLALAGAVLLLLSGCGAPQSVDGGTADGSPDARLDAYSNGDASDTAHDSPRPDSGGEICDNGLDDDRNGLIDDGCPCLPGSMQSCFDGDPSLAGVGPCHRGTQHCGGSGEIGTWDACVGSGIPAAETCDGQDNDCNGAVDDGFGTTTCGEGPCVHTEPNCVAGVPHTCVAHSASPEVCDGIDNDCNGMVDDGLGTTTCGTGVCVHTVPNCVDGVAQTCTPLPASSEVCDGLDNDCNGTVDDGLGTTSCGIGACARTVQNCVAGVSQTCIPGSGSAEVCDGIDNDCNGMVDEGLGSTTCGIGPCIRTVPNCVSGVPQTCTPGAGSAEVCNGIDDNCNGTIDEGTSGAACTIPGQPCRTAAIMCSAGTPTCTATGSLPAGTVCGAGMVCDGLITCVTPINCIGSWGACSAPCGGGTQTYTITRAAQYGGTDCPYANGTTQSCNTGSCGPYCTVYTYPYVTWTCPDGDHSTLAGYLGCACSTYDSSGQGVGCGNGYSWNPPLCDGGAPATNVQDHAGSCGCHL